MIQIPKGNAFKLKVDVTAVNSEESVLPGFDIRECTSLEVKLGCVRLEPVQFELLDEKTILVPVSADVGLGKYTLDVSGEYQGEAWRFDIQDVFQIVQHSLPAPQYHPMLEDEYQIFGVATIYNTTATIDAYTKAESDARFVQKVNGKGLSTNDYTDEDKRKVGAAITQETDPTVPGWAKSPNKPSYTAEEVGALPADTPLFSGDYNDLSNKPAIPVVPTNVSAFNNDAGYLTAHQDVSGKEDKVDIVVASGATLAAAVGKYYTLTGVGTVAITLPTIPSGTTKVQTVSFYVSAGSSPAVTFTSTHNIYYSDGFEIAADSTFEVSALWNGIAWVVASVKIVTSNS